MTRNALKVGLVVLFAVMAVGQPMATVALAASEQPADLTIHQPRHVSEGVNQLTEGGGRVYEVRGEYLEIFPENFNPENVTSFQVRESEGVLSYDKRTGAYILNTQGVSGTYNARWTVSRQNRTVIYTAAIRVIEAEYAHVPESEYERLQNQSSRGQDIIQSIQRSGDPDKPVEAKVAFGNKVRNFANNPFSALTGQFMALQTIRFLTPAGWLDLGLNVLIVYLMTRGLYGTIARLRKQLEEEEKVARREDVQYIKMMKQFLSFRQMTDVDGIDDHQAAVLEDRLGPNLFTALRNFWSTWGATNLKRMYVDAMGAVGYRAHVTTDSAGNTTDVEVYAPGEDITEDDGGDGDGEPTTDGGEDAETVNLSNLSDEQAEAVTWEQVDDRVFQKNPDVSAVDHLMTTNRAGDDDLIADLKVSIPEDFQSRREFMEAIGRFLRSVMESDFVDEHGEPREDRTAMNHLIAFTTIMEQEHGLPLDLWWRAAIWNAEGLNRDDEAESVLSDITDATDTLDDVDGSLSGGGSVGD